MIYTNNEEYKVYYYQNSNTKNVPVLSYIQQLPLKNKAKISAYISFLRNQKGYIDEPYGRYVCSGIRELRVEISHNKHRIFYITVEGKRIILLHAFLKKTRKTSRREVEHALNNFKDYQLYKNLIEYEEEI
ncbi:MAG: type II toxin-antitoxin system RelE/ParE family toxin [Candidatus Paceibacterota bacterium]|jgi:phage-related protein